MKKAFSDPELAKLLKDNKLTTNNIADAFECGISSVWRGFHRLEDEGYEIKKEGNAYYIDSEPATENTEKIDFEKIKMTEDSLLGTAKKYYVLERENKISSSDAWYEMTGQRLADSTAKSYISAINTLIDTGRPSEQLKRLDLGTTKDLKKGENGDMVYVQTSNMIIALENAREKTPVDMMILHGYDPAKWIVIHSENKSYQQTSKLFGTATMYSSTVKVKPSGVKLTTDQLKKIFDEFEAPEVGKVKKLKIKSKDIMYEMGIVDPHLGKLAWAKESGEDYDLKIGADLIRGTVNDQVSSIKQKYGSVEQILFPIGQDTFHVDNEKGETTKGTRQSTDSRWQKMLQKGNELHVWAVKKMLQVTNKVKICYVKSNHDEKMSYALTLYLSAWFRNDPRVEVSISPYPRKYFKWGLCMVGLFHKLPKKTKDKVMQEEASDIWGSTIFREFHGGHEHVERLVEFPGFKMRNISGLTATGDWACGQGYIGIIRQLQGFAWHSDCGIIDIHNSVVKKEVVLNEKHKAIESESEEL